MTAKSFFMIGASLTGLVFGLASMAVDFAAIALNHPAKEDHREAVAEAFTAGRYYAIAKQTADDCHRHPGLYSEEFCTQEEALKVGLERKYNVTTEK